MGLEPELPLDDELRERMVARQLYRLTQTAEIANAIQNHIAMGLGVTRRIQQEVHEAIGGDTSATELVEIRQDQDGLLRDLRTLEQAYQDAAQAVQPLADQVSKNEESSAVLVQGLRKEVAENLRVIYAQSETVGEAEARLGVAREEWLRRYVEMIGPDLAREQARLGHELTASLGSMVEQVEHLTPACLQQARDLGIDVHAITAEFEDIARDIAQQLRGMSDD